MTTYTTPGAAVPPRQQRRDVGNSRAWAATGLAAGVTGFASIVASLQIDAAYLPETIGKPKEVVKALADQTTWILINHTFTIVTALLLLVFAAGLKRRLEAQAPVGSLLPAVASSGLGLVSVAGLLGSGLTTEFVFGIHAPEGELVPESADFYAHWVATISWLWVGAGVAGVAIAAAALRHSAAPRWIGWVGAILGGLTLVLGVSPVQYMAGFTGPIWLLVTALGFVLADRPRA
ncbi:hypothetical protein [Cryptosporangium aurantiacum]|uniref:DUF4386 family protein n=1 Tax=Cryptosporangium aurantiacum TaxID=134849 RepID=A0A1M7Q936_9ACTN|nr:hypothetical protein [Cryptosporangium aurantiacum]SHN27158.1 hypothetical protein SAMN05443668_104341 [Cryptosporangium aurantiacum]